MVDGVGIGGIIVDAPPDRQPALAAPISALQALRSSLKSPDPRRDIERNVRAVQMPSECACKIPERF
jgi:hypothetical protein